MADDTDHTCDACGADMGRRTHCPECGAVLHTHGDGLTWALGELTGISPEGEHEDLEVKLAGGKVLTARAAPGCKRLSEGALVPGDQVELLGRRREIFEELRGGLREAPERRSLFMLEALGWGEEAGEQMEGEMQALGLWGPLPEPGRPVIPWPEGLEVRPPLERGGLPRLRILFRLSSINWLPFSLGLPVAFFAYFFWMLNPASRPFIGLAVAVVVGLLLLFMSSRRREIVLGPDRLAVQYGRFAWPRRTVTRSLKEIRAIYVSGSPHEFGVRVQLEGGSLRWLLPPTKDPARAVLVAALLERALGMPTRTGLFKEEVRPELPGQLPDLDEVLRPPYDPDEPTESEGRRRQIRAIRTGTPRPKGVVEATRRGDILHIILVDSGINIRLVYLAVPAGIWLLANWQRLFRGSLLMIALDVLACLVGAGLIYAALAGMANRTTITLSPAHLSMKRGPLPWPGKVRSPRTLIKGLEKDTDMVGSKGGTVHHLYVRLPGGRKGRLIYCSGSEERVYWVKRTLQEELGL